jgi:hypothetical protein
MSRSGAIHERYSLSPLGESLVEKGKFTGKVLQRELVLITHLFTLDSFLLLGGEREPGEGGEVHWQGTAEGAGTHHPPIHS